MEKRSLKVCQKCKDDKRLIQSDGVETICWAERYNMQTASWHCPLKMEHMVIKQKEDEDRHNETLRRMDEAVKNAEQRNM